MSLWKIYRVFAEMGAVCFGGCTINLVKEELYEIFIEKANERYKEKYGKMPKVYDVVIGDGSRKIC